MILHSNNSIPGMKLHCPKYTVSCAYILGWAVWLVITRHLFAPSFLLLNITQQLTANGNTNILTLSRYSIMTTLVKLHFCFKQPDRVTLRSCMTSEKNQ